jgi:hypothetical protein
MGVSLSTAERLQAIPGPWPTWVTELIKKYITEPGTLGTAITWEQKRGRPFQNIAAFIILAYEPDRNSVPSAQAIEAFFKRDDAPDRHFVRKVEMALSLFVNIAVEHFDESFGVIEARIAPVGECLSALLPSGLVFLVLSLCDCVLDPTLTARIRLYRSPDLQPNGCPLDRPACCLHRQDATAHSLRQGPRRCAG